jgi:hypothetical protein
LTTQFFDERGDLRREGSRSREDVAFRLAGVGM